MVVSAEDRAETVPQESMGHERTVGVQVEPPEKVTQHEEHIIQKYIIDNTYNYFVHDSI